MAHANANRRKLIAYPSRTVGIEEQFTSPHPPRADKEQCSDSSPAADTGSDLRQALARRSGWRNDAMIRATAASSSARGEWLTCYLLRRTTIFQFKVQYTSRRKYKDSSDEFDVATLAIISGVGHAIHPVRRVDDKGKTSVAR